MTRMFFALAATLVLAGCYHAKVNTGIAPNATRTEAKWAHGWLWGLVPPSTVDAAEVCGGGVATRVETQVSPANGLVGLLTGYIYTPMTIQVMCGGR